MLDVVFFSALLAALFGWLAVIDKPNSLLQQMPERVSIWREDEDLVPYDTIIVNSAEV